MHKGFTHATLGILGAALLSGSAFAAGPTIGNLPSLIITDKHKAEDLSALSPAEFDFETEATENRYRFTEAFDLAAYVGPGDSAPADIRFLFTEFASPDGTTYGAQRTAGDRRISIEGDLAGDVADDSTGLLVERADVLADPKISSGIPAVALDFVDTFRSGGDGSTLGPDPGGLFTDYAIINLHVASTDNATGTAKAMSNFTVVTTNDTTVADGDTISAATSVLTPELCQDLFVGWHPVSFGGLPDFSNAPPAGGAITAFWTSNAPGRTLPTATGVFAGPFGGTYAQASDNPSPIKVEADASPGNTGTTNANFAPQYALWQSWRRDQAALSTTVPTVKDRIYLMRWTLASDANSTAGDRGLPDLRIRAGEPTTYGMGLVLDVMAASGANGIAGPAIQEHRSYYYAHEDGEIGFGYDVFDFYQGTGGGFLPSPARNYGVFLHQLDVYSFTRDDLSNGTQLYNVGGETFSLASGAPAPPATGRVPFAFGAGNDWDFRLTTFLTSGSTTRANNTGSTADVLQIGMTAGLGNIIAEWDTRGFITKNPIDANTREILGDTANSEMLILDAWMSTPNGANNLLPILRFGFQSDAFGESGSLVGPVTQGRTAYHEFRTFNRTDAFDVGVNVPSEMALQNAARRYTFAVEPNIRAASATTGSFRPWFLAYSFPARDNFPVIEEWADDGKMAGTIRIHRVVVTKYDRPEPTSSLCP